MKKVYLSVISVLCTFAGVNSQSIILTTPATATSNLVSPLATVVNDDTSYYYNASASVDLMGKLYVINNTASSMTINVKRTVLYAVGGSINQFCWGGLCYAPNTNVSTYSETIAAGDTNKTAFYTDYFPYDNAGVSYIKYRFYNLNDTSEFVETTVRYAAGTTSIEEQNNVITSVYPNPATDLINFNFATGNNITNGTITITDLSGKIVKTAIIPENPAIQSVDVSQLTQGVYIYSIYANNKVIATKKFVVKK